MSYQPVTHVVTDGNGHVVRIDECSCEPTKEGDNPDCLVHGEPAAQMALTTADIEAHRRTA